MTSHSLMQRLRSVHPLTWLAALALALRLLMFAGRGDYVAFDEGWYLLLGRNLMAGDGFSLSGLRHVTLSPLFPIFAGAVDLLIGDAVWSGRIVAATAAGLLVVPCWFIFSEVAGRRTATLGSLIVIALPALAPFVVPYWIGRELWVGAEPLLHLFLFTAIALVLHARRTGRLYAWIAAGAAFGLAYLARPEAILVLGAMGLLLGAEALYTRRAAAIARLAVFALAFCMVSAPYWLYLHDALGRWTITGRGISVSTSLRGDGVAAPTTQVPGSSPSATIERMLWAGDASSYVQRLYALDAARNRLASDYWGVPRRDDVAVVRRQHTEPASATPILEETAPAPEDVSSASDVAAGGSAPSRPLLYVRALGTIVPWFLWPFVALGVIGLPGARVRRQRSFASVLLVGPLLFASAVIAGMVAIDPRTQLFLLPLAALYGARGIRVTAVWVAARMRSADVSRDFLRLAVAAVLLTVLFGTQVRWLYMSLSVGSPHHIAGRANRTMGGALDGLLPERERVMSWHPAIALFAGRDWRVLPHAGMLDIVRYADAAGVNYMVVSPYYPGPKLLGDELPLHLVVQLPDSVSDGMPRLTVHFSEPQELFVFGRMVPEPAAPEAGDSPIAAAVSR